MPQKLMRRRCRDILGIGKMFPSYSTWGSWRLRQRRGRGVANLPGFLGGVGIGLAGVAGAHLGGPQIFWKFAAPKPKWIARLQQVPEDRAASSFELSRDQISKHTSHAVAFK